MAKGHDHAIVWALKLTQRPYHEQMKLIVVCHAALMKCKDTPNHTLGRMLFHWQPIHVGHSTQ